MFSSSFKIATPLDAGSEALAHIGGLSVEKAFDDEFMPAPFALDAHRRKTKDEDDAMEEADKIAEDNMKDHMDDRMKDHDNKGK